MAQESKPQTLVPVIVDVGRIRKKNIDRLKDGHGPVMREVRDVVDEVSTALADRVGDRPILPVVLIYKEKRSSRRRGGGFSLFPFPMIYFGDDD